MHLNTTAANICHLFFICDLWSSVFFCLLLHSCISYYYTTQTVPHMLKHIMTGKVCESHLCWIMSRGWYVPMRLDICPCGFRSHPVMIWRTRWWKLLASHQAAGSSAQHHQGVVSIKSMCMCLCVWREMMEYVFQVTTWGMSHLLNVAFTSPPVSLCEGSVHTKAYCVHVCAHFYPL